MCSRVNEASGWNVGGPGKSSEGNKSVAWHKQRKTDEVSIITGWLKTFYS